MLYRVAEANSYLVITGAGIEKLRIRKKSWVYPFQKVLCIFLFVWTPCTPFSQSLTKFSVGRL
ncbi:hypothetical protein LTR28_012296 [Elasticomyces elasticus]|nr:hypothetical protein LTR28_012296 [Elasticomyces elasticus]